MKDFYATLATDASCNQAEIQEAYENFFKNHPVAANSKSRRYKIQSKQIRKAYFVLSDPEKRQQYDQQLAKTHPERQFYTKAIDLTFTLVLVFFTVVFGDYVLTSIHQTKAVKAHQAVKLTALHQPKTRKKKPFSNTKVVARVPEINRPLAKISSVSPEPVIVQAVFAENGVDENGPDLNKNIAVPDQLAKEIKPDENPDFLYITALKANETGKINLRQTGSYDAEVILVIPSGSKVFVLEKGSAYYKVRFENSIGYVPRWTLALK